LKDSHAKTRGASHSASPPQKRGKKGRVIPKRGTREGENGARKNDGSRG